MSNNFLTILLSTLLPSVLLGAGLPTGHLLYSGMTPTGWQVFDYDLVTARSRQLTEDDGDKREPFWSAETGVVCRAEGALWKVSKEGHETRWAGGTADWADYTISPDASFIFATRLVGQRVRRQHIYSYDVKSGQESPFLNAERGSYSNLDLSSDGRSLALIHIVSYGNVRLGLVDIKNPKLPVRYLTPEWTMAESPRWGREAASIYVGLQFDAQSVTQVHRIDVSTGESIRLPLGFAGKTTFPSPLPDDSGLFFQFEENGVAGIAFWQRENNTVTRLDLGRPAVEPFYIE